MCVTAGCSTDCVTKVKAKKGELRQLIADQKDFKACRCLVVVVQYLVSLT